MRTSFNKIIFSTIIVFTVTFPCAIAQPAPPGDGSDPSVPLDGGASAVIAAGIGLGIKKIYDKRKNRNNKE